ncbi:hypothetical protein LTR36_007000 [Oleoguttula mirabilis]|uniref:F-box domain-containing protein n=1 Tax=Oleoguttula mirabilis TaxID=1507867 RepID=A0AAV9JAM0_9PEZI|nr:hypothetical protein LTR36_007000 [Oleoguttula mirabilis]
MASSATEAPLSGDTAPFLILNLPNELLDRIADLVTNVSDLSNLRLAGNARLSQSALDATAKRMTTVYIEHSKVSLERFREVCRSPAHARQIREVKFIATIRTATPADVAQCDWFSKIVKRENVANGAVDAVLATYLGEKAEQAALMAQGEPCATLCEYVKRLPNLSTISLYAQPHVDSYMKNDEHELVVDGLPARAYNTLRRWRRYAHADLKRLSREEGIHDQLLYAAHFGVTADVDSMEPLVRSMAVLAEQSPTPRIKLVISGPLTVLGSQWAQFAKQNQQLVESALQITTSVDINAEQRWGILSRMPADFEVDLTTLPHWDRLLSSATHIRRLTIGGKSVEVRALLKHVTERTTFPELEDLALKTGVTHWRCERPPWVTYVPFAYSAQALGEFLLRHRTLKHLLLQYASGKDDPVSEPSATSFAALLNVMKASLPRLQSASVRETHVVFYKADAGPTWSEGTPYGHLPPAERDRAREQNSEIGQLARSCGIIPDEHPSGLHSAGAELTKYERGRYGYGPLNRAFWYEYDFGPYVLGHHTQTITN